MAIIITMAGEGKRARKMFNTNLPKFEIKINNKSFFDRTLSSASFIVKIKLLFLSLADALLEVSEFIFLMIFTIIDYGNFKTWLIIMSMLVVIAYCYEIFYELIVKKYSGYSSRKINFLGPILFYPLLFFYRTIVIILYPFYRTKIYKLFKRNTRKDNTYEKNISTN